MIHSIIMNNNSHVNNNIQKLNFPKQQSLQPSQSKMIKCRYTALIITIVFILTPTLCFQQSLTQRQPNSVSQHQYQKQQLRTQQPQPLQSNRLLTDTFQCLQNWRSDGNYYSFDYCMKVCDEQNQYQNVTNVVELSYQCCKPICDQQISYHVAKRTAIIVVVSILLFLILLCCLFGCFGHSVKQRFVLYQQRKKRKPISSENNGSMSVADFQEYKTEFQNIFTQDNRNNWQMLFVVQGQQYIVQWFTFQMKKKSQFQYKITMRGQDIYGLWKLAGYFTHSTKGIMAWGIKNYQNLQNTSLYYEKQFDIVQQYVRINQGNYQGQWYNRRNNKKSGKCSLKNKGWKGLKGQSNQNLENYQIVTHGINEQIQ